MQSIELNEEYEYKSDATDSHMDQREELNEY